MTILWIPIIPPALRIKDLGSGAGNPKAIFCSAPSHCDADALTSDSALCLVKNSIRAGQIDWSRQRAAIGSRKSTFTVNPTATQRRTKDTVTGDRHHRPEAEPDRLVDDRLRSWLALTGGLAPGVSR